MESKMLKKYLLIGILAITVAQLISAFTLVRISRSNGLLVGQPNDLVIVDKGERDFLSPSLQLAAARVGLSGASVLVDKGERDFSSSSAPLAASLSGYSKALEDKGERDFLSSSLQLADKGERDLIP
jgi:hypothetical protein